LTSRVFTWLHCCQASLHKHHNFSLSLHFSLHQPGVSKTQCGFFQFVVAPLFGALERAFPLSSPMVAAVDNNHEEWNSVAEKHARAAAASAEEE
jgi:hypothetical protein